MDITRRIAERTISAIPISIGTSLALESIFEGSQPAYDSTRLIPVHININQYDEIWINLSTLIRNIQGALDKETFAEAKPKDIKDTLLSEIDIINNVFEIEGKGTCRPVYYKATYKSFKNKYANNKNIRFRKENTAAQQHAKYLYDETLRLLAKETDDFINFDSELLPKHRTNSLIITHIPYDLLSKNNFNKLDLLESHTGKLKSFHDWYTKYYPIGDTDMSMLPFNKLLLLVFGDNIMIHPSDMKLRRLILDVAEKGRWTTATTISKIMMDFDMYIKEPYVVVFLKSL